jgi:hypothetical protein
MQAATTVTVAPSTPPVYTIGFLAWRLAYSEICAHNASIGVVTPPPPSNRTSQHYKQIMVTQQAYVRLFDNVEPSNYDAKFKELQQALYAKYPACNFKELQKTMYAKGTAVDPSEQARRAMSKLSV